MNRCINPVKIVLKQLSKQQQQWFWFIALWLLGFASVTVLGYGIKWLLFSF